MIEHWYHSPDEVHYVIGKNCWIRLPAPPEGDAYDLQAMRLLINQTVDPARLLVSARRTLSPVSVKLPWWKWFTKAWVSVRHT